MLKHPISVRKDLVWKNISLLWCSYVKSDSTYRTSLEHTIIMLLNSCALLQVESIRYRLQYTVPMYLWFLYIQTSFYLYDLTHISMKLYEQTCNKCLDKLVCTVSIIYIQNCVGNVTCNHKDMLKKALSVIAITLNTSNWIKFDGINIIVFWRNKEVSNVSWK